MAYLLLVAGLAALLFARKARPASERNGVGLNTINERVDNPESHNKSEILKVATYNIQTGKSDDGHRDITASAQVLAGADIVGVQEVYAPSLLNNVGVGLSQTEQLANIGGFGWLFCATRRRYFKDHRGNALLSKLPVTNWQIKMLPDRSGKSYRNLTIAEVEWQHQRFYFLNTHLHTKTGRSEQIEVVLREFSKYSPAILVGDFNCTAAELNNALSDIDISDAIDIANIESDPQRIDWILSKGFKVVGGEFFPKGVSDHPYYQTNLQFQT